MKKIGYVIKKINKNSKVYFEVIDLPLHSCMTNTEGMQLHDCSTCQGCSSFSSNKKTDVTGGISFIAKAKIRKEVSVGDRIEYSVSGWIIAFQVCLFLLLPVLSFAAMFLFCSTQGASERMSILLSFVCLSFTVGLTSTISHFFLKDAFLPTIV